jgi:hypothetical protein
MHADAARLRELLKAYDSRFAALVGKLRVIGLDENDG